jgi:hypothetical protein
MHELGGAMDVPSGSLDVTMFDHRPGVLRPGQPPAECAVNDASVAQGLEGLLSYGSTLCDRRARQ